jgi:hypothetical protein
MINTSSKYANPTVVTLTATTRYATNVTIATPAKDTNSRNGRWPKIPHSLPLIF